MQATVLTFDSTNGHGSIVTDEGVEIPFSAEVFAASGLRLLRPGQRVRLRLSADRSVESLTIITLADPR